MRYRLREWGYKTLGIGAMLLTIGGFGVGVFYAIASACLMDSPMNAVVAVLVTLCTIAWFSAGLSITEWLFEQGTW